MEKERRPRLTIEDMVLVITTKQSVYFRNALIQVSKIMVNAEYTCKTSIKTGKPGFRVISVADA